MRFPRLARRFALWVTCLSLLGPAAYAEPPVRAPAVALVVASPRAGTVEERPETPVVPDTCTIPADLPAPRPTTAPDPPGRLWLQHRALLR